MIKVVAWLNDYKEKKITQDLAYSVSVYNLWLKYYLEEAGETTQGLRAFVAFTEDLSSVSSIPMVAPNHP